MRRRENHEEASKGTQKNRSQKIQKPLPENRESAVQMVDAALREHGIDYEQRDRLRLLLESCEEYRKLCGEAL